MLTLQQISQKWKRLFVFALMGVFLCSTAGCGDTIDTNSTTDTMTEMTSSELVADMGVGWNLGDTLDVCVADRDGDGVVNETPDDGEDVDKTLWGNVEMTLEFFQHLKADGVDFVRIPVT
ncbi:MAG: hypothetical protein LUF89_05610 [Ruminococcus sp.]|nr:hypothetical protein [Ruminococcus sp.]